MIKTENIVYNISEISTISKRLLQIAENGVICFYGDMGSGKTTLIKELVRHLGGVDTAISPTFNILYRYFDKKSNLIAYHMDLFRIESEEEIFEIGLDDIVSEEQPWIFIEWPKRILPYLPGKRTDVHFNLVNEDTRELLIYQRNE